MFFKKCLITISVLLLLLLLLLTCEADFPITFVQNFDEIPNDDAGNSFAIDFTNGSDFAVNNDDMTAMLNDENLQDEYGEWYHCDKDLRQPHGIRKYLDFNFLKKFVRNLNPFSKPRMRMYFYLFKREFPDCGRELDFGNINEIRNVGFNASLPTRIIIHGWMSQSRGSFNRDIKSAYLKRNNFNIIVTDWSTSASNLNYFAVANMIEELGAQLAQFSKQLVNVLHTKYNDIYLIGHSLGAQIAGAAGKRIKPAQYNTIFALDPAGPKFRHRSTNFRIDPTDAKYVESIQTSANLGFIQPTGMGTFYPNYGIYQKKCYYVGCSHIRAYKMFAESINSNLGFWGTPCKRHKKQWFCDKSHRGTIQMGGEPAVPKRGLFHVQTAPSQPFALGKNV